MKCSYCTREIEKGTGLMYVKKNGAIRYYCSSRCFKFDVIYRKRQNPKEIKEIEAKAKS
ncbi:MAG: 50S ribosomal protein L24e [Candidatus Micrarchaeia archaeon]